MKQYGNTMTRRALLRTGAALSGIAAGGVPLWALGQSKAGSPFKDLGESFGGRLILPSDSAYEQARRVWNAMIDRHPAAIAQCADVDDVVRAVRFARSTAVLRPWCDAQSSQTFLRSSGVPPSLSSTM